MIKHFKKCQRMAWDTWPMLRKYSSHSPLLADCHFWPALWKLTIILDNEKWKIFHFCHIDKCANGGRQGTGCTERVQASRASVWAWAIIKVYASVFWDLIKNKKNENFKLFDCQMRVSRISGFTQDIYCYFCFQFVYVN